MMKKLQTFFLFSAFCLILVNAYQLFQSLSPQRPIAFSGIQFAGLGEILKNEIKVGYITDRDINDTQVLAEFEQAQYMLAPSILEWNNTKTRFFLVNCSTEAAAFEKLKQLGAQPLKRNQFGIILALNPMGMARP